VIRPRYIILLARERFLPRSLHSLAFINEDPVFATVAPMFFVKNHPPEIVFPRDVYTEPQTKGWSKNSVDKGPAKTGSGCLMQRGKE